MSIGNEKMVECVNWVDGRVGVLLEEGELMTMIHALQVVTGGSIGSQDLFKQDAERIRESLAGAHEEIFAR